MEITSKKPAAIACVYGGAEHSRIRGKVRFYPSRCGVLVSAEIRGLPESETGFFAFHIHEGGSCSGAGFPNTGNHYNPMGTNHPGHAGDLPPLLSCNGKAHMSVLTNRFRVREVIGCTVVIHSNADDFTTQPSGNAGTKIACGVIHSV